MKIRLLSDLHVVTRALSKKSSKRPPMFKLENIGEDVLVLAGDICESQPTTRAMIADYLEASTTAHVVFVPGNHEYYGSTIAAVHAFWTETDLNPDRFHYLQDSSTMIEGVLFYGCTMWTDMGRGDYLTMKRCEQGMNDYAMINDGQFTPKDSTKIHIESVKRLREAVAASSGDVVVVTHHLPSLKCINEKYKSAGAINYAYASTDLDDILAHDRVKLWMHGHTHDSVDIDISGTRVVCNPFGYGSRRGRPENKNFQKDFQVTLVQTTLGTGGDLSPSAIEPDKPRQALVQ